MPELPDVEGWRRFFDRHARGKRIKGVSGESEIVRNSSPQGLGRALKDRRFEKPRRHGKWLICPTDEPVLLIHFGMTGELVWSEEEPESHQHDRLTIGLDAAELRYRSMRKLGGVWLTGSPDGIADVVGPQGPDAYEVSEKGFTGLIEGRRGSIKAALMDQKVIAGLGNLTVDESLWHARIAPRRQVSSLDEKERRRLYAKTQKVLRDSIPEGRVPPKRTWLTRARDERESRCPRCDTKLESAQVSGRTSYWCPSCQPGR